MIHGLRRRLLLLQAEKIVCFPSTNKLIHISHDSASSIGPKFVPENLRPLPRPLHKQYFGDKIIAGNKRSKICAYRSEAQNSRIHLGGLVMLTWK